MTEASRYPDLRPVLDVLWAKGFDVDPIDVADACWLAMVLACPPEGSPAATESDLPTRPPSPETKVQPHPSSNTRRTNKRVADAVDGKTSHLYAPRRRTEGSSSFVLLPDAPALPDKLALARALRPLRRRVDSGTRTEVDETATANLTATRRLAWADAPLVPVFRPARTRWLDAVLLVDRSQTMAVWRRALEEWTLLIHQLGAFRDVRVWHLIDIAGELKLVSPCDDPTNPMAPREVTELADPTGRRLVLIASDCIGPLWSTAPMTDFLEAQVTTGPLAILQLLPPHLWRRTVLAQFSSHVLSATAPGLPAHRLDAVPLDTDTFEGNTAQWPPPIPVVPLHAGALAAWAKLVLGAPSGKAAGYRFVGMQSPLTTAARAAEMDAAALVRRFLAASSSISRRLASYLAAVPLTAPVMRLVRQEIVSEAREEHLIEVLFSGLVFQRAPDLWTVRADEELYDFYPGVREQLLSGLELGTIDGVARVIGEYLERTQGAAYNFFAVLDAPIHPDDTSPRPFATVSSALARVVRELDTAEPQLQTTGSVPGSADSRESFGEMQGRDFEGPDRTDRHRTSDTGESVYAGSGIGRALVIGASHRLSPTGRSVSESDAERMSALLQSCGFDVCLLVGLDATRDRILASYIEIISSVGSNEAVVIYYAGSGGIVINMDTFLDEFSIPRTFQYIGTSDYLQSTDEDFRGISSWELSLLLEGLTRKTRNVTLILDCSHAAQMSSAGQMSHDEPVGPSGSRDVGLDDSGESRDVGLHKPRESGRVMLTGTSIHRHLNAVRSRPDLLGELARAARLDPRGNANAVRIVASGEHEQAFTRPDGQGGRTGVLTHALIATLEEVGSADVSWRAIGEAIRLRILEQTGQQRPRVEGPVNRRPFSLKEVNTASIPITNSGDEFRLWSGHFAGVSIGDVYGVTRSVIEGFNLAGGIARVRVEYVAALHATARLLEWLNGHTSLSEWSVAWPIELEAARHPVRVVAPGSERPLLEDAVRRSVRLRVAESGERAIGELCQRGGKLEVLTEDGVSLRSPTGSWSLEAALDQLQVFAAARSLSELRGEGFTTEEAKEIEVEWGTIHNGVRIARSADGSAVGDGERIYVKIRNRSKRVRYAHVFHIDACGVISRLSEVAAAGILIGPREASLVGPLVDSSPEFELIWPELMPRDAPSTDELVVIVTAHPADLGVLETHTRGMRGVARGAGSPPQRLLAQFHGPAAQHTSEIPQNPFLVVHCSWMLHPLNAPVALGPFAVDEDPQGMHGVSAGEAWRVGDRLLTRPVEIRLRKVTAAQAVRIDSLVCTRSADRERTHEAHTFWIAAGAALRGDGVLWRGLVRDLMEVYLWAAPDASEATSLIELMEKDQSRQEVMEAIDVLVVHDPQAPWALASGACAVLANVAVQRLRSIAPGTAGLVHASFVANENYGADGRHRRYQGHGIELEITISLYS